MAKFKKTAPSPWHPTKAGAKEKESLARSEAEEDGIIHDDFTEFEERDEDKSISSKSPVQDRHEEEGVSTQTLKSNSVS